MPDHLMASGEDARSPALTGGAEPISSSGEGRPRAARAPRPDTQERTRA